MIANTHSPVSAHILAMAGKGGTGKTTLSALLIRYLVEKGMTPVLAVDADANENLNELVGLSVKTSLGDIKERMKTDTPPGMAKKDYMEMYINQAIIETKGFDLLVMGQPEGPGCYCMANTILAQVIERLARNYHYLIVDNEAGMEHLSRMNLRKIHTLFVVSDPSIRGIVTAARIADLTKALKIEVKNKVLVVNRGPKELPKALEDQIREVVQKTDLLFGECIPTSEDILKSELQRESLLKLSAKTEIVRIITRFFDKFL